VPIWLTWTKLTVKASNHLLVKLIHTFAENGTMAGS